MSGTDGTTELKPAAPLTTRIRWLLLARVLIVTIFLAATALTYGGADPDPDFPLQEVSALIVVGYLFSLLSVSVLKRISRLKAFAYLQVSVDVFLISVAVVLTGGLRSPMAVWYNLAIIAAALLLFRRGAFAAAGLSSVVYAALMTLAYWGALPFASIYPQTGTMTALGIGLAYQVGANIGSYRNYPRIVGETGGKDFVLAHPSADAAAVAAHCRSLIESAGPACVAAPHVPDIAFKLVDLAVVRWTGDAAWEPAAAALQQFVASAPTCIDALVRLVELGGFEQHSAARRQGLPGLVRERVRHPRVAAVHVVFY